jgi:hypothetical protein
VPDELRGALGLVHPTTDAAVIRKNCTQRPNAAIAVATGEPDLLAVMITRTTADAPQTDGWGPPGRPSGLKRRGRRNRTR